MSTELALPTLAIESALDGVLRAALVWARGLPGCPASRSAPPYLAELLGRVRAAGEAFITPERKAAVRGMLRHGKYKPAGRSKPSSEYLLAAALEGEGPVGAFPLVNGPVDANNAVSLEWGYPASVFDTAKSGLEFLLRRGLSGESYIFNPSGQVIELEDLIVACVRRASGSQPGTGAQSGPGGSWEPRGNPVKDAMATKVFEDARDIAAIVYAPASDPAGDLEACAARFAELLGSECAAAETGFLLLP